MTNEPTSPTCYGAQADDAYMGYADTDELVAALNELLEAERAGARVALGTIKGADDPLLVDLMHTVHHDEARWCAMLNEQVQRLGAAPSAVCGTFYGKAMAIADPVARLAFLNRGQSWVVRRLEKLLPRVRDDELHAALADMLRSHVENIEETDRIAARLQDGAAQPQ